MSAKTRPEAELSRFIDAQLRSGVFTHAYVETGFLAHEEPVFTLSHAPDGRTTFDLASLTKALVTTNVFFSLCEEGKVSLDTPIGDWLPRDSQIKDDLLALTARELLSHQSGLPAWRNFYVNRLQRDTALTHYLADASRHIQTVLARDSITVGEKIDRYSDVGFILLGYAIERLCHANLARLFRDFCVRESIVDDQKNPRLFFTPDGTQRETCVPTSECRVRGRPLVGEVHDENCAALGGVSGHAGLFGTGNALAHFLKRFFQTKTGRRALAENKRFMTEDSKDSLCGYQFGKDANTAAFCQGHTFGHYGFTGTAFWIEPDSGKYVIFLTNRVVSGRINPNFRAVRKQVFAFADEIVANA